jgi:hypothetical protein
LTQNSTDNQAIYWAKDSHFEFLKNVFHGPFGQTAVKDTFLSILFTFMAIDRHSPVGLL